MPSLYYIASVTLLCAHDKDFFCLSPLKQIHGANNNIAETSSAVSFTPFTKPQLLLFLKIIFMGKFNFENSNCTLVID